jgi:beta-mannosidase
MAPSPVRRTRLLDGGDWQVRAHVGLEAALAAAVAVASPTAIHAVHTAADAAEDWIAARVPGSILDDLARAGEVPDPYFERNSCLVEWVPERAWTYRRSLEVPQLAAGERAWLRFEGIDHAGHVFLDGERVASHAGMFVPLEVEITERLGGRGGADRDAAWATRRHGLAVVVEPAPDSEPQVGRTSRVRIHKARMSYGWDFSPRLVHQGLWQSVALITAGPVRIADVWGRPILSGDLRRATVSVDVRLDAADDAGAAVRVSARLDGPAGVTIAAAAAESIRPSQTAVTLTIDVDRPELWWPNGLGAPMLHDLVVEVALEGDVIDERRVGIGFRRIERRPNAGASPGARPWTFVVNGRVTEVAGWNWTPLDTLYGVPRPERLAHLLGLVRDSGANLVRVWGGGLIETETFYDACDRLGLLVWQEFSQSSSGIDNTPSDDPEFVALLAREAEAIVPLRRNHPSLAIWCGGNELQRADGRPLEDEDSPALRALHDVVTGLDPDRIWLPTSPSGPRFRDRLEDGAPAVDAEDVHGPWEHQGLGEQHDLWDRGASLFNGEFGVEGMTNRRAHETLISAERRWPADRSNPIYRHLGDWWNNEPMVQAAFGGGICDLETLRRASQWLQADGLRYAVEANRRRWPRNTGSIPWQLNESYPNAWCTAVVDHSGEPKPAYHAVRRAFAPTLVCARFASPALGGTDRFDATVVAWSRDESLATGSVRVRIVGSDGVVHHASERAVRVRDGLPIEVENVSVALADSVPEVFVLDLAVVDSDEVRRAANRYVIARGADLAGLLHLPPAIVDATVERDDAAWRIHLTHRAGAAALGVLINDARPADVPGWPELDDNLVDLLPGEIRTISVAWADDAADDRRLLISGWNLPATVLP